MKDAFVRWAVLCGQQATVLALVFGCVLSAAPLGALAAATGGRDAGQTRRALEEIALSMLLAEPSKAELMLVRCPWRYEWAPGSSRRQLNNGDVVRMVVNYYEDGSFFMQAEIYRGLVAVNAPEVVLAPIEKVTNRGRWALSRGLYSVVVTHGANDVPIDLRSNAAYMTAKVNALSPNEFSFTPLASGLEWRLQAVPQATPQGMC